MKDSECSMGERLSLTEAVVCSARMLSGEGAPSNSEEFRALQGKIKEDNQFFGIKSLFDEPMKKVGTVTKVSKGLSKKTETLKTTFMQNAEPFVFSCIDLLGSPEILASPEVTGRLLLALSQILSLS